MGYSVHLNKLKKTKQGVSHVSPWLSKIPFALKTYATVAVQWNIFFLFLEAGGNGSFSGIVLFLRNLPFYHLTFGEIRIYLFIYSLAYLHIKLLDVQFFPTSVSSRLRLLDNCHRSRRHILCFIYLFIYFSGVPVVDSIAVHVRNLCAEG